MKKKAFVPPPLMTNEQIATIKGEIADIKSMLKASDETKRSDVGYFNHSVTHLNVEEVQKAIGAREKQLKQYTPQKLKGNEANKALSRAKELKVWIRDNIPKESFTLYPRPKDPVKKTRDFERAVDRQVQWAKNGESAIQEYHYLMRRVDPSIPREDFSRYTKEKA